MKIKHDFMKISDLTKIRDTIHLNPAWQRGPVWTQRKKALLLDSILRRYDVPMIYLRECKPQSTYAYEVVDGQQRLRSIWDFIDGEYALIKDLEKVESIEIAGKKYKDLPMKLRNRLNKFPIVIAFIKNAREPEISRLFSRMQMGVRLNPAELRNAVQTGLRHSIDAVAQLNPFFQNSRIPPARFKHQDYLAHAVSICIHGTKSDLKASQLMADYINLTDDKIYAPIMADALEILDFLNKVNQRTSKRIKQKWIFVDLFYLLFQNKKRLKKIKPKVFASVCLQFDRERLKHNAEPEKLLAGKPTKGDRDLYNYIIAFKISGGERKNLEIRNMALNHRFGKVFGV